MADSVHSSSSGLAATNSGSTKLAGRIRSRIHPKIAATPVGTGVSGPLLPLPPSRPPARGRVVNPGPPGSELVRFLGVAAFLTIPVALSLFNADGATHDVAHTLAGYSPERLVHGAVWTIPLSALLLPNVRMIGPTTIYTLAFLLPYALMRGPVRALVVFFTGHIVATVSVAVIAIGGHVAGSATLEPLYRALDVGASAGLAAVVGGLAEVVLARSRLAGIVVVAGVAAYFLVGLVRSPGILNETAEVQHLLALGAGLLVERHWNRSDRAAAAEYGT
jgi:hypothetical protein